MPDRPAIMTGLRDVLAQSGIGVWSFLNGVVRWDGAMCAMYGVTEAPCTYEEYLAHIHPDERDAVDANVQRFMATGVYEGLEHRIVRPDGDVRWVMARGTAVKDAEGQVIGLTGTAIDITEQKALDLELRAKNREIQRLCGKLSALALRDDLTGANNRRWFEAALASEVERAHRYERPLTLVILDVDDFKRVNDTCGHDAGDEVLKAIVSLLEARIRAQDKVARWGGDEIVVIMPETGLGQARRLVQRLQAGICAAVASPLGPVSVSSGSAELMDGEDWKGLFHRADQELLQTKTTRRATAAAG